MRRSTVLLALVLLVPVAPAAAQDLTVPAARDTDPVVVTGKALGGWAVPSETTARVPLVDLFCGEQGKLPENPTEGGAADLPGLIETDDCPTNHYATPDATTAPHQPAGTSVDRLLGYRWNPRTRRFVQIPFQVDEVFTRYLNNAASGFSPYSGEDRHTTYAYDREGFRYRLDGPEEDPCTARPDGPVATDPIAGLDHDDELAFMAFDAGPKAPAGAKLPKGVEAARQIRLIDPTAGRLGLGFVYVMRASARGARREFDASNGYVSYERDANADHFAFSQSSYDSYGNAPDGYFCDDEGRVVLGDDGSPQIGQRRPRDTATITTSRYRFRYDGRWLMSRIEISPDGGETYGPDLVDRWKARAFAQDPGSETPCCGYEEEDANWGGSSVLLGERVGPVRAIRETWGADSATNAVRRETFYRDTVRQRTWLRVHPVPPLDGIYAQWDFNAGRVTRFYNAQNPAGVPVDGVNDEAVGNLDDPCNPGYDDNTTSAFDQAYRSTYRSLALCGLPYHLSADPGDPTFADANAALGWSQVSGPHGTIVDRITASPVDMPAAGTAQGLFAVPYYRDDSCFDDGTGTNPGPKLKLRSADEPSVAPDGTPRRCWTPKDGVPLDDARFYQGSIATHGVHLLFVADSDNARLTVPLTEIITDWDLVMLPGDPGNVGERYGRSFEKPLLTAMRGRRDFRASGAQRR